MSALLKLRDYQTETIRALHQRWDAGAGRVPSVLATGLGKTVIFAHLIAEHLDAHPLDRALVLVHTDELALQAAKKMREVAPHLSVGIVKAERNEVAARVLIGSVQTLRNPKRLAQVRRVSLIVVDECHHAVATTYQTILRGLDAPGQRVAGFTATLARGDKLKLSDIWEEPAVTYGISFGIRRGYLLDVRGKRIVIPDLNLSNVRKQGGDFADGALATEMDRALAPEKIAEGWLEHASDRKGIAFWPTVEMAEHGEKAFLNLGIPSETIHGKLGREERRAMLRRLRSGETQVIHGVGVLTEGFDDPTISCVGIFRPTRSAPLYQQMVGRGLRPDLELPAAERGDCLVLEAVGAGAQHDLRTLVDLSEHKPDDAVEMDEELTLLGMEEMWEEEEKESASAGGWPEEEAWDGDTETVDFDPLGRTTPGAWLHTFEGHYFLPIGRRAYALIVPSEEPGRWDVAWIVKEPGQYGYLSCPAATSYPKRFGRSRWCGCGEKHEGSIGALTEHRGLSLEMACSWAEEVMEEVAGKALAARVGHAAAEWRGQRPNITLLREAWDLSIPVSTTRGMTKGELTDTVEILTASKRIDPVVQFMMMSRETE